MTQIEVKSVPTNFTKGGKICHQLFPKNSKPMTAAEFIDRLATALGKGKADARYINDVHGQVMSECLVQNKAVNTGNLRGFLVVGGSVATAGAQTTKEDNPVSVCFLPLGDLKATVEDFEPLNVTQAIEAILYNVQYEGSDALNTIEGTGNTDATGVGLAIVQSRADEGVWLEAADGTIVTEKATITKNDTNLLVFSFAELPEAGTYKLVIATRDGNSADDYGVTRLVRNVIVK